MNPLDVLKKVLRNRSALLLVGLVVAAVGVYLWAAWEPGIPAPATARAPGVQPVESVPGGPQTPEYDRLQKMAGQHVNPDSFTHGTSRQRMDWFQRGYQTGDLRQCDTFRG